MVNVFYIHACVINTIKLFLIQIPFSRHIRHDDDLVPQDIIISDCSSWEWTWNEPMSITLLHHIWLDNLESVRNHAPNYVVYNLGPGYSTHTYLHWYIWFDHSTILTPRTSSDGWQWPETRFVRICVLSFSLLPDTLDTHLTVHRYDDSPCSPPPSRPHCSPCGYR